MDSDPKNAILWGIIAAVLLQLSGYAIESFCFFELNGYDNVLSFYTVFTFGTFFVPMAIGGVAYMGFLFPSISVPKTNWFIFGGLVLVGLLLFGNTVFVARVFYSI